MGFTGVSSIENSAEQAIDFVSNAKTGSVVALDKIKIKAINHFIATKILFSIGSFKNVA